MIHISGYEPVFILSAEKSIWECQTHGCVGHKTICVTKRVSYWTELKYDRQRDINNCHMNVPKWLASLLVWSCVVLAIVGIKQVLHHLVF